MNFAVLTAGTRSSTTSSCLCGSSSSAMCSLIQKKCLISYSFLCFTQSHSWYGADECLILCIYNTLCSTNSLKENLCVVGVPFYWSQLPLPLHVANMEHKRADVFSTTQVQELKKKTKNHQDCICMNVQFNIWIWKVEPPPLELVLTPDHSTVTK